MARTTQRERPEQVRCAIYTRKSTSHGLDQEFNSLEAQYEYCDARVRDRAADGWRIIAERYDDGGYTGSNTDRPAFQRLMRDVEAGKIDVVVVYKVDRLCRSLLDFAKVMDRFQRANVAFVSVTQNFSTADAMGRLTLNMLMSFAEFEREMIAERTRDKIHAARRRGKWTGGVAPLGYRVEDKRLVIDETSASLVRELFDLYLELESAVAVAARINETAPRSRPRRRDATVARRWTKNDILRILQNPVYAGFTGIGDELHEGEHAALIPRPLWQRVQAVLTANRRSGRQRPRNLSYILRSVLRCAACGAAMTPAPTRRREREYRYYRCVTRDKGGRAACAAPSLAAERIEAVVEAELRRLSVDPDVQGAALAAAHARLIERRESLDQKRSAESARSAAAVVEAERLASRLAACEPGAQSAIERRLAELHDQQSAAEHRRAGLERQIDDIGRGIERLDAARSIITTIDHVWPQLTWASRARLVRTLVDRVEVAPDGQVRIELASSGVEQPQPEEHRGAA